eukprot:CAMPEP_0176338886 /NCGR_PEP_ID=MMETSP0126-20121128/309_1 /TAXON_ID=141414 ORGANISM="Strombidinopsis acuminatum, Strain SPMC142" /NCGR_SAMPLE_ID=MMETSP0126 /ASSEMBLY_ACC=CAM_ASM_000229 /LENGTH=64 /DNA_ID=CAMNT_0017682117 /DNA_START=605 /DNA_END=798 /DNA_ORIENTATION=-
MELTCFRMGRRTTVAPVQVTVAPQEEAPAEAEKESATNEPDDIDDDVQEVFEVPEHDHKTVLPA